MNIFDIFLKQSIKCQVKIGSNYINTYVKRKTTCIDFLISCLSMCKLTYKNLHKSYSLLERCNGIERYVRLNENIFELIKNFKKEKLKFELIIKKMSKSTKFSKMRKNMKCSYKISKILNKQTMVNISHNESHFYEDIQDLSSSKFQSSSKKSSRVVYSLKTIQKIRKKLQSKKIFDQEFIL